ncbi:MAG: hypothetical protein COA33_011415 [Fluviicola sp.]|nr:hypothetical protein [Fluviicola sp.]
MLVQNENKLYKGVVTLLFLLVFAYILLRAIYTDPLHDEIATFIFYFYHGDYIGPTIQWDANNHLLNSFLGHQLYKVFGDNLFILRLPNVLAFILYFWGLVRLTQNFKTVFLKFSSLFSLACIPFILEYFAYARGYGLSLGFFVWGIIHFLNYQKEFQLKHLFYSYLFLILAVSANLTLINSTIIILGINIITPFFTKIPQTKSFLLKKWSLHLLCVLALLPFIAFGLSLKMTGALYYGNLSGLWELTGKSLSKLVLFSGHLWVKYLLIALLTAFTLLFFRKKENLSVWAKQPFVLLVCLLFGNIIAILLLARVFSINFPEDRTGMYLVILILLVFFHFLENLKLGKWLQLPLLFFPISLLTHISLDTSIFSPEQRMNHEFYLKVKEQVSEQSSITIYQTMNWNWPYAESHQKTKASVAQFDNPNSILYDVIVTRTGVLENEKIPRLYDTIATHEPSGYIAFKRKENIDKISLNNWEVEDVKTSSDFYTLATINVDDLGGKDLQIDVAGHLKTFQRKNKIQLIVHSSDNTGATGRYLYYSFEACYQGSKIDDNFLHHFIIENVEEQETEIKVYLWNRASQPLKLTGSSLQMFELKTAENELR